MYLKMVQNVVQKFWRVLRFTRGEIGEKIIGKWGEGKKMIFKTNIHPCRRSMAKWNTCLLHSPTRHTWQTSSLGTD